MRLFFRYFLLAIVVAINGLGCANESGAHFSKTREEKLAARLIGKWVREHETIWFFADGTYANQWRHQAQPAKSVWHVKGDSVIHTEGGVTVVTNVISVTKTELKMTFGNGARGLDYERIAN